jgi:hypothetical protein
MRDVRRAPAVAAASAHLAVVSVAPPDMVALSFGSRSLHGRLVGAERDAEHDRGGALRP